MYSSCRRCSPVVPIMIVHRCKYRSPLAFLAAHLIPYLSGRHTLTTSTGSTASSSFAPFSPLASGWDERPLLPPFHTPATTAPPHPPLRHCHSEPKVRVAAVSPAVPPELALFDFPEIRGRYRVLRKIGEGTFSSVFKAERLPPDGAAAQRDAKRERVALKRVYSTSSPARVFSEIRFLHMLVGSVVS